jgi:predicted hydrolase (HD superfamily)
MKDKGFARGVNREDVIAGAQELGVDLDEHVQFVIEAMKGVAADIGLGGALAAGSAPPTIRPRPA